MISDDGLKAIVARAKMVLDHDELTPLARGVLGGDVPAVVEALQRERKIDNRWLVLLGVNVENGPKVVIVVVAEDAPRACDRARELAGMQDTDSRDTLVINVSDLQEGPLEIPTR